MHIAALVGSRTEIVGPEAAVSAVARLMADREVGAVAVVDRSGLVGICTDRDLAMAVGSGCDPTDPVSAYMSEGPDVISPDVSVRDAAAWMLETGYRHLPVISQDELVGIIDIRDVLWALVESQ